jgi:hypothetical protein
MDEKSPGHNRIGVAPCARGIMILLLYIPGHDPEKREPENPKRSRPIKKIEHALPCDR